MALAGRAFLAIWNTISTELDRFDYDAWLTREHLRERADIPGFLRARRYCGAPGTDTQGYFNCYELDDAAVLDSAAYRARVDAPSALTEAMKPALRTSSRGCYEVLASLGDGIGGALATLRFEPVRTFEATRAAQIAETLYRDRRATGVHLAVERAAGGPPDGTASPHVLLLEGASLEALQACLPSAIDMLRAEAEAGTAIDSGRFVFSYLVA